MHRRMAEHHKRAVAPVCIDFTWWIDAFLSNTRKDISITAIITCLRPYRAEALSDAFV